MDRDLKLFGFLEKFGVLSMGQVWVKFFKRPGEETMPWLFLDKSLKAKGEGSRVYKRMTKLVNYGFLERTQWFSPRQTLFRLTSRGHWQLVKRGTNQFSAPVDGWPNESELLHNLLVGTLGMLFEYMLNWKVQSEREVEREYWIDVKKRGYRYEKPVLPDLLVRPAEGAEAIRVELELTLKSDSRYKELWGGMNERIRGNAPYALYIAGNAGIQKRLLELAQDHYCPGLYCCTLEEFKRKMGYCEFTNSNGKIIRLKLCRRKEDAAYVAVNDH